MESILESNSSMNTSSESTRLSMKIKAASAPVVPLSTSPEVKQQTSAPSYFHSLRENDAPPFVKPGPEPQIKLKIGSIFNEAEVIEMVATLTADREFGLRKYLTQFLISKNIIRNHDISEKNFLISFLAETIDYAAQRRFNAFKLSVLLTLYLDAHCYFKWYYWQTPVALWNYFKEMMIRHTIEDSPDGQEVFEPQECYDIISHFHTVYLSNLSLIHILTFRAYRLKFTWPYKKKE